MLAAPRVSSLFITNLHLLTVGLRSAYQPDVQRGLAVGTASWYLSNIMCPLQGKLKGDCGAHGHGQGKAPVSKRVAAIFPDLDRSSCPALLSAVMKHYLRRGL